MLSRRKRRVLNREIPYLKDTSIIFVGIEGGSARTSREARYLDIFRELNIRFQIKVIPCDEHRSSPDQVLNHLKEELKKESLQEGDEKWLVIDVDKYEIHLPQVAQDCLNSGIDLAVSNPCFEYWLLLHYQDQEEKFQSCNSVKEILASLMDADVNNNQGYSVIFRPKVEEAIERAEKKDNSNLRWPNENGSRVYKLVKRFFELNK